jgi:hypothetical protein
MWTHHHCLVRNPLKLILMRDKLCHTHKYTKGNVEEQEAIMRGKAPAGHQARLGETATGMNSPDCTLRELVLMYIRNHTIHVLLVVDYPSHRLFLWSFSDVRRKEHHTVARLWMSRHGALFM